MSDTVRKTLFGVSVIMLLVLAFLASRGPSEVAPEALPTPSRAASPDQVVVQQPQSSPLPVAVPLTSGPASPAAVAVSVKMPLTQAELEESAAVAVAYVERYTSFRYDQDQDAWRQKVLSMLANLNRIDVSRLDPPGPALAAMRAEKRVVTSKATVTDVYLVAKTDVSFNVRADTVTTRSSGPEKQSTNFMVSLSREGAWRIIDAAPEGADVTGHAEGE